MTVSGAQNGGVWSPVSGVTRTHVSSGEVIN